MLRRAATAAANLATKKLREIVSSISESEIEPEFGLEGRQRRRQDGGEDSLLDFTSNHLKN